MSYLKVTLIDVGWGDSILIEASDGPTGTVYALIDSNDNADNKFRPTWDFIRKQFGLSAKERKKRKPFFDIIVLTHDHSDHGSGLRDIIREYGTKKFWHPKINESESTIVVPLRSYVDQYQKSTDREAIDTGKVIGKLGDVDMDVLWPPPETIDMHEPNNNSIVLALTLSDTTILLTGDAEGEVWSQIANQIPANTRAFKVPHHGSRNGTIHNGGTPWVDSVSSFAKAPRLAISCHPNYPNRFDFPHDDVLSEFDNHALKYLRTDIHYHITFTIEDGKLNVSYSHAEPIT